MMLEIASFADAGVLEKERLIIRVLSDLDIGAYIVLWSDLSDSRSPTAGIKTAYWFPDKKVKSGDKIVLYSKSGKDSKKDIGDGHSAHFFYWGLENALWENEKTAVLLKVNEWIHRIHEIS